MASKPFDRDSVCWVASLTKIITVTSIMQIVERGLVALDDSVEHLVPELAAMQILRGFDAEDRPILEDNSTPITLRYPTTSVSRDSLTADRTLLTHTLGLGYDLADPDLVKWSKYIGRTATNLDWTREGFNTPIKFAPGEGWWYGAAVDWAGLVLEKMTGKSLGEYMQENIFDPLQMRETGFWPEKLPKSGGMVSCTYREGDQLKPGPLPVPKRHEMESGGAGLFSTARDYALFFRGLLQGRLLKEESLKEMFTPQLNDTQSAMLETICYAPGSQIAFAPEFPRGLRLNHGIGGVLNCEDVSGKRRAGSLMWSGMCNSRWVSWALNEVDVPN